MTTETCPRCGHAASVAPPEPPLGTWVKDRHGGTALHHTDREGHTGWAPPGCYAFGRWEAMWEARGPLTVCGPWGAELESDAACP